MYVGAPGAGPASESLVAGQGRHDRRSALIIDLAAGLNRAARAATVRRTSKSSDADALRGRDRMMSLGPQHWPASVDSTMIGWYLKHLSLSGAARWPGHK